MKGEGNARSGERAEPTPAGGEGSGSDVRGCKRALQPRAPGRETLRHFSLQATAPREYCIFRDLSLYLPVFSVFLPCICTSCVITLIKMVVIVITAIIAELI